MIAAHAVTGHDVVAVTDHNRWYDGACGLQTICGREVLVLCGNEVSRYRPGLKRIHVVAIRDGRGGTLHILSHAAWTGLSQAEFDSVMAGADAYEIWSHTEGFRGGGNETLLPYSGYDARGKPAVYVTDAHCLALVDTIATYVFAEMTTESVCAAIRAGLTACQPPTRAPNDIRSIPSP